MATLKGVFPDPKPTRRKNFIHENVRNLRRMEQFFSTNKEIEELQNVQMRKHQKAAEKYQNITARVNSSFREAKNDAAAGRVPSDSTRDKAEEKRRPNLKASVPMIPLKPSVLVKKPHKNSSNNCPGLRLKKAERGVTNNKHTDKCNPRQGKVPSDPNLCCEQSKENNSSDAPTKYKSRGVQTLDEEHMENLYSEGVIRYPSSRSPRRTTVGDKNESSQQTDKTPREEVNPPSDRGDVCASPSPRKNSDNLCDSPPPGDAVDFIKLNKQRTSVAHKLATQLNHGVAPPNYRKGVVPKYLRERKEAQQQKEREAKEAESHPDCPEGHVPLPDNERKETLRMLKKNYQEFVKELNMMPIKTDTLRSQRRKMEIEKQLNKLEEGIKVFSRPKVYVKVNA